MGNESSDLTNVREFWEANPLASFESPYQVGSEEFFNWHDTERYKEAESFAMPLYEFDNHAGERVLDVGCGIGWVCKHFAAEGTNVTGIDITMRGVKLTRQRLQMAGMNGSVIQANAEVLPFQSNSFDFIVSSGVLHHTPNTRHGVQEIYRVLKPGGRAMISLYYRNWLLAKYIWPLTRILINRFIKPVPGRKSFRYVQTVNSLVRLYDGDDNPLGKCYSRQEMLSLLNDFYIEHMEVHYFPKRFLPFGEKLPEWLYQFFDKHCGLMIYATLCKNG